MNALSLSDPAYRRDLGDDLVLRWSTPDDAEELVRLTSHVFRDCLEDPANPFVASWTGDLMSDRHPLITSGDFALVEDTFGGMIVAATCLLSQIWEYAGIPIPVGRPEVVSTEVGYRNRGLVRAIFDLIHARSAARGHLALGITGIPYFYRQFGYEYALDLGGSRSVYFAAIPQLKEGEQEPFSVRDATVEDLPFAISLYDRERAGALVSTRVDERYWRFRLEGFSKGTAEAGQTQIIVDRDGRSIGYVLTGSISWQGAIHVFGLMVEPGVSLVGVMPTLLRLLQTQAAKLEVRRGEPAPIAVRFELGDSHPAYDALGEALASRHRPPYGWYVRAPDLPCLVRHLAPVLDRRLADSVLAGHCGDLKLDFYRGGLRLVFEAGKLQTAADWKPPVWSPGTDAGFPPLVFLQLLFGRRSLAELRHAFPDVWVTDEAPPLLDTLFPKHYSWVMPLD